MATRVLLAILLLLAGGLLLAVFVWPTGEGTDDPSPGGGNGTRERIYEPPPDELEVEVDAGGSARTEVSGAGGEDPAGDVDAPGLPSGTSVVSVRGRVLDVAGSPLAGVPVVASSTPRRPLAETDGRGRFAFELAVFGGSSTLTVPPGRWAPVRDCVVRLESAEREHILVAAPAIDLAGLVEERGGPVLAEARVSIELGDEILRDFPLPLDRARTPFPSTRTDETGRFVLERIPAVASAQLRAYAKGYRRGTVALPASSRDDLVLSLEPAEEDDEAPRIEGVVLLPDRSPAAGATVRLGHDDVETGADGGFSLESGWADDTPLVAGKKGYGTVIDTEFGALVRAWYPEPPPRITLVLGEAPREIAGQVVDAQGRPQAEWEVYVLDATALSEFMTPPPLAEEIAGGELKARTGEDGRFRLAGLLDRSYVLRAYDRGSLLSVESEPLPAGTTDARLVVPAEASHEFLRGTVVGRDGSPVAGVRVQVGMVLRRTKFGETSTTGARVLTDEEGEFALPDVPRHGVRIELSGEHVIPRKVELGPDDGPDGLVLEVARRRHFRIVAKGRVVDGIGIELLDAAGAALSLYRFQAGSWGSTNRIPLGEGGSTAVRSVSEDAVTLRAVVRGGRPDEEELLRQAVYLDPEGVTEIVIEFP